MCIADVFQIIDNLSLLVNMRTIWIYRLLKRKYEKWFCDVIICHPQIYQKNMYHHVSYGNLLLTLFFYSNLNGVQLQYTLPFLLFWTQWWNFLLQRRKSDMHTMFLICENFRRRRRKILHSAFMVNRHSKIMCNIFHN